MEINPTVVHYSELPIFNFSTLAICFGDGTKLSIGISKKSGDVPSIFNTQIRDVIQENRLASHFGVHFLASPSYRRTWDFFLLLNTIFEFFKLRCLVLWLVG
jgi:hypothetical protein